MIGSSKSVWGFDPRTVPGCQLWLDAADQNAMTLSGSSVTQIIDKSSNGYTFTGSAGTYPTQTATLNGLPVISTSTGRYLRTTNFNQNFTNATFFSVLRPTEDITPNGKSGNGYAAYGIVSGTQSGDLYFVVTYANQAQSGDPSKFFIEIDKQGTAFINGALGGASPSTYNPVNTPLNIGGVMSGSSSTNSAYLNGTSVNLTFNLSGTFPLQSGRTVNVFTGFGCDHAEVLIYGTVLTPSQRQQVEGYLAHKWGLQTSIPSTHPFYSIRPHLRTFQPIDVPGCQLWLDAADASTVAIATGVSQLMDKSGNGYNLTQSTTGNQPSYSSNLITFSNNTYLNIPQAAVNNLPTWSLFFVINPISSSNWIMVKQKDGANTYNVLSMTYNTGSGGGAQTGSNGFLYWRSLNAGTQLASTAALSTSTLQFCNLTYDGTNLYFYKNGELEKTTAGSFTIPNDTSATNYTMGIWIQGGTIINSGVTNFRLGEMLVYNTGLTTSERQQVEGYLAHKWGLTPSLPVISPLSIPGCQLWLDGSDQSSMTLSGSSITQLRDKSGNGNHMVSNGTSPLYNSSLINSVGGIDCTNGGALISSGIQNSANISFAMVAVVKSGIRNWGSFFTHGDRDYDFAVERQENTSSINFQTANDNSSCTITFTLDAPVLYFGTMTSGTSRFFESFSGGVNTIVTGTNSSTISLGSKIIRVGKSDNNNEPCNSFIGEIIYYTTVLTTTQRQQIEGYLARKWGISISATLPSPHPFKSFPPASLPFSPRNISGLALWLDAADQSSMTLSGSSVTQIIDKSSNAYTFTGSVGTYPTRTFSINGLPVISTSTGKFLQITNFNQNFTNATFFSVLRPTEDITPNGKSGNGYAAYGIVSGTQSGDLYFVVTYANQAQSGDPSKFFIEIDKQGTAFINGALGGASPSTYNPVNTPLNIGGVMSGSSSTNSAYLNGTSVNLTFNLSGTFPLQSGRTVRIFYGFGCDHAEVLIYGTVLTPSQRQQVEGYLAQKWGLTTSLPATHPYVKLPA